MAFVWEYDEKKLKKSERGRLLLLERQINGGVFLGDKKKISLKAVKKNWDSLHIEPRKKRVLKMLIWGK
jgi:hypothetical protein